MTDTLPERTLRQRMKHIDTYLSNLPDELVNYTLNRLIRETEIRQKRINNKKWFGGKRLPVKERI